MATKGTGAAVLAMVLLLATAGKLTAIFMMPEARLVPVERLVNNLERQLKADPKNVQTLINLGRLHAMAYALKVDEFQAVRGPSQAEDFPYYPPQTAPVPSTVQPAKSPAQTEAANRHLQEAIRYYEAAVAVSPNHPTAHLGLGWVLQQAKSVQRAITEYRRVVELAWQEEEKIKVVMPSQTILTDEAIGYLLPLLDPKSDGAEIAELKSKQQHLRTRGRAITPVAVPLADDIPRHEIVNPAARVRFDADGSGILREWTWIGRHAAWLVHDQTGQGDITSALQLFGNVTFWLFWETGYQALQALDDDGDGELRGAELRNLALWRDRNSNGVSERGEVQALSSHGIIAVSSRSSASDDPDFAAVSLQGLRLRDGRTRPTYDVVLRHSAFTLTGVPRHHPTNLSFATEQPRRNRQKQP